MNENIRKIWMIIGLAEVWDAYTIRIAKKNNENNSLLYYEI